MVEGLIVSEEGVPLGEDLACARCGYNLRGLMVAGKCPECGAAVAKSVEEEARRMPVPWLRIAEGAVFFLALLLMPWAWRRVISIIESWAMRRIEWPHWLVVEGIAFNVVSIGILACGFICLMRIGRWARGVMRVWQFLVWTVIGLIIVLDALRAVDNGPFWLSFRRGWGFLREIPGIILPLDMLFRAILLALAAHFFRRLGRNAARPMWGILLMLALLAASALWVMMAAGEAAWSMLYRGMNPTPWDWLLKLIFDWSPRAYWTQFTIQVVIWPLVIAWAVLEWRHQRRAGAWRKRE